MFTIMNCVFLTASRVMTPEEAEAYIKDYAKRMKELQAPVPPSNLSSTDLNNWQNQQRARDLEERKRRIEAENLLRNYRNSSLDNFGGTKKTLQYSYSGNDIKQSASQGRDKKLCEEVEPVKVVDTVEAVETVEVVEAVESVAVEAVEVVEEVEAVEAVEAVEVVEAFESVETVESVEAVEAVEADEIDEAVEVDEVVEAAEATEKKVKGEIVLAETELDDRDEKKIEAEVGTNSTDKNSCECAKDEIDQNSVEQVEDLPGNEAKLGVIDTKSLKFQSENDDVKDVKGEYSENKEKVIDEHFNKVLNDDKFKEQCTEIEVEEDFNKVKCREEEESEEIDCSSNVDENSSKIENIEPIEATEQLEFMEVSSTLIETDKEKESDVENEKITLNEIVCEFSEDDIGKENKDSKTVTNRTNDKQEVDDGKREERVQNACEDDDKKLNNESEIEKIVEKSKRIDQEDSEYPVMEMKLSEESDKIDVKDKNTPKINIDTEEEVDSSCADIKYPKTWFDEICDETGEFQRKDSVWRNFVSCGKYNMTPHILSTLLY